MNQELRHCRASIAKHSKSFALASRLLPPEVSDAAAIVYAWCRRADDAVDLASVETQPEALQRLKTELDGIYEGAHFDDIELQAFQRIAVLYAIPKEHPAELLAGMAMDVNGLRYSSWDELIQYCYRVASTVGLMMCHVMGVRDAAAHRHAAHLGIGMQLTNICRDVHEDWQRGRLYLPDDELEAHGLVGLRRSLGGELPSAAVAGLRRAVGSVLNRADDYYRSGDAGLKYLSWRSAVAVSAARWIYSDIGAVLRRNGCNVLAPRAFVSKGRKLWLCFCGLGSALKSRWQGQAAEGEPLGLPFGPLSTGQPLLKVGKR